MSLQSKTTPEIPSDGCLETFQHRSPPSGWVQHFGKEVFWKARVHLLHPPTFLSGELPEVHFSLKELSQGENESGRSPQTNLQVIV